MAEFDGELVGYADVQADGYIDHFFVSGDHPRQGIGGLLMERIHKTAAEMGLSELTSDDSRTAQPLLRTTGLPWSTAGASRTGRLSGTVQTS